MHKTQDERGRWASWPVAPIIVAALLALMWPSVRAASGPATVSADSEPTRVYVPLALYNAPAPPSVFAVQMKEVSNAGGLA